MNAVSGYTYYVARCVRDTAVTHRVYLACMGNWTCDIDEAERFTHRDLALQVAKRFRASVIDRVNTN